MGEVKPADGSSRIHRKALRQLDARILFSLQQVEQGLLFGVIGARRIPGGWANALILLLDQLGDTKIFFPAKAPSVASFLVRQFGQALLPAGRQALWS